MADMDKIEEAVAFILHPDVINLPVTAKREFLHSKGLSDDDINLAFSTAVLRSKGSSQAWSFGSAMSSVLLLGGLAYLGYRGIQSFLNWLTDDEGTRPSVETTNKETDMTSVLNGLQSTMSSIERRLKTMEEREADVQVSVAGWKEMEQQQRELKAQLESLRSVLLARNSFPGVPKPQTPGLVKVPAWQLKTDAKSPETPSEVTSASALSNGAFVIEEENDIIEAKSEVQESGSVASGGILAPVHTTEQTLRDGGDLTDKHSSNDKTQTSDPGLTEEEVTQ